MSTNAMCRAPRGQLLGRGDSAYTPVQLHFAELHMPKKGDPPNQSLFDFVERLQPAAKAVHRALGLDKITPDLVARMQGFPSAKALDEFLKKMRAQDEQLQALLKNVVPPVSSAKPSVQPPVQTDVATSPAAKPAEAPAAEPPKEQQAPTASAPAEPAQLEFPIHLPSARALFGSIGGIAASFVSLKAIEAAALAAKFLWGDPHYLYAAVGAVILAAGAVPAWSALRLTLLSTGVMTPKRPPRQVKSRKLAYGLQILVIGAMLSGSVYLFTTAYRMAAADWVIVYTWTSDWIEHQKGVQEWRRKMDVTPETKK